jgi:hypothetical protein
MSAVRLAAFGRRPDRASAPCLACLRAHQGQIRSERVGWTDARARAPEVRAPLGSRQDQAGGRLVLERLFWRAVILSPRAAPTAARREAPPTHRGGPRVGPSSAA